MKFKFDNLEFFVDFVLHLKEYSIMNRLSFFCFVLLFASVANAQSPLVRAAEGSSNLHLTVDHQGILDSISLIEAHLGRPIAIGTVNVFDLFDSLVVTNNLVDQDNDGLTRATDCDDYDALTGAAPTWYEDADEDSAGDPSESMASCDQPTGYVAVAGDGCPTDASKTTAGVCGCGAAEVDVDSDGVCDTNDDCTDTTACNYTANPTESCTYATTWYADNDGDGLGDASNSTTACEMPAGYVSNNSDADDGYPGAVGTLSVLSGNSSSGFSVTFAVDQPINTENFDITIANSDNNNTSFYHSYGLGAYNVAVGAVPITEGSHTLTLSTVNTSGEALFPNVTVNVQCECDMGPGDKDMCDYYFYGNWACTKQ